MKITFSILISVFISVSSYAQIESAAYESSRFVVRPNPEQNSGLVSSPAQLKPPTQNNKTETKIKDLPVSTIQTEQKVLLIEKKEPTTAENDAGVLAEEAEKLHAQDPRLNLMNLSLAPGYLYVDSSSNYWFHDYSSSGPGLGANVDVWFSDSMGIQAKYFTTLTSELKTEPGQQKVMEVDHRFLSLGFQYRKFSTLSRRSSSLYFGLNYNEYELSVPKDEAARIGLKSSGVALTIGTRRPETAWQANFIEVSITPKVNVSELSTGVSVKSGDDYASSGIQLTLGREWTIDRSNNLFLKLSHRYEKTIYEGAANTVDPRSGVTPSDVSVSMGMTRLDFGFTWGD